MDRDKLVDYIYKFAFYYGMYYHLGSFEEIMEQVSQKIYTPEEFVNFIQKENPEY